jgi:hypothetical protein
LVVWLASFPRSGNTFFRIAAERLYGVASLSVYDNDPASVSMRCPGKVRAGIAALRDSRQLHLIKTHELPDDNQPAVLLVRDGRDAMVSYAHFIEDYQVAPRRGLDRLLYCLDDLRSRLHGRPRFETLLRRVVAGEYFDWSQHYRAWRRRPGSSVVVRFEDLVVRPGHVVHGSLSALGLPLPEPPETSALLPAFSDLHAGDPKFFRAGGVGQWRSEMSAELESIFWRLHHEAMLDAGYER